MAAAEEILTRTLEKASNIIDGVTCGAGMPYKLSEIAARFGIYYYPIVSSARAFNALWKRSYRKTSDYLGGVVYEDPWLAGGHNGLSNSENPLKPQPPYPRVRELRKLMNEFNLHNTPIIMAGGVWYLEEWEDWIDNPELGPIVFQFGTRPLLTKESPIPKAWKDRLFTLKKGDIKLHRFSPTGFYSSAVKNSFIKELMTRVEREFKFFSIALLIFSEVRSLSLCAPPIGSSIISSITFNFSKSLAESFIAFAASSIFFGSLQRIVAHPSGDITE